ncbi:MAG: N-acetyltransferase family protein [Oligoflexales bacterium]
MAKIDPLKALTKRSDAVVIRTAVLSDASQVLAIAREAMAEGIYTVVQVHEAWTVEQLQTHIQEHLDGPAHLFLVADVEGTVVGSIDFSPGHRQRVAHTGEFGMTIAKEWREQGIGSLLLRALLGWAEKAPEIDKVNLTVHSTNERAMGLYKKLGFKVEGRRTHDLKYGPDSYVDTVLMGRLVKEI